MKKIFFLAILITACSSPEQGGKEAGDIPVEAGDVIKIIDEEVIGADIKDLPGDISKEKPKGYAALRFYVDDSANKTYADGELVFTGSFSWDEETNIVTYATSWLPEDGPFPALYDDGPRSQGGHEFEGATKGDSIFSTEVWFKADSETVIEYGALNEFGRWIWIGPNGQVTIPQGSEDTFDLKPLVLPKFGETDLKITLDIKNLHPDFATITPDKFRVFVKGSMNSWTPVQILDNGEKGDDAAGDGIFTYLLSANLGKHDGLLYEGQHAQFVFIFAMEEIDPDDGSEYKVGGADGYMASDAGVAAFSNFKKPEEFKSEPIIHEKESRGADCNTTVVIGGGNPWCGVKKDCCGALVCKNDECVEEDKIIPPKIQQIYPSMGSIYGGDSVTIYGENFQQGAKVFFGDKEANVYGFQETELTVKTPANQVGFVEVKVENPDGGSDIFIDGFEYVEPAIKNLPDWGRLNEPLNIVILAGDATPDLFAEVYEKDMTEGLGKNVNVLAQVGYGAKGSGPSTWQWMDADYSGDSGNNDLFTAVLSGLAEGEYGFSFRFSVDNGENWLVVDSDGTQNGFAAENAGLIKVLGQTDKPIITSIKPDYGATTGGEIIEIKGGGFGSEVQVLLDETFVAPDSVTDTTIKIKTPKNPAGYVDVIVINGSDQAVKQDGFLFVPKGSPVMDGYIGADWDETFYSASNTLETNWMGNSLKKLHFCYDGGNIYIGVEGVVESENYIVGYLDMNYGVNSGFVKINQLQDNSGVGELDDALSSFLDVKDANFSPEFGFGTKGMQSFTKGTPLWPGAKEVGVRKFASQDNFSWIDADVRADGVKGHLEVAIPLAETGLKLPLSKAQSVALFIRIINKYGDAVSNQALPEYYNSSNIFEVGSLFVVDIK